MIDPLGNLESFVPQGAAHGELAKLAELPGHATLPGRARLAAATSLAIWVSVAACGRLIAYF